MMKSLRTKKKINACSPERLKEAGAHKHSGVLRKDERSVMADDEQRSNASPRLKPEELWTLIHGVPPVSIGS
jgi:hypothetical protein